MPGQSKPETFVIPQTVATESFKKRAEKEKMLIQAALEHAVRLE